MHRGKLWVRKITRAGAGLLCCALPALAAEEAYKTSPEYEALSRDFRIVKTVDIDVDGDTQTDVMVLFRDRQLDGATGGGILVFRNRGGNFRPGMCLVTEGGFPADVSQQDKEVTLSLGRGDRAAEDVQKYPMVMGRDWAFRGEEGDPFAGVKITATSTLRGESADAKNVYDGDLTTSWAEGASGTGIGESVVMEFKKAVALGMIYVFPGKGNHAKEFRDFNRVHRMVVEVGTQAGAGDSAANLDFADLGIDVAGNKTEVNFANRPEMKFIKVGEEDTTRLTLRVDSVYLGDKKDDTHMAEVGLCQLLTESKVQAFLRRQSAKKSPAPATGGASSGPAPGASSGKPEGR